MPEPLERSMTTKIPVTGTPPATPERPPLPAPLQGWMDDPASSSTKPAPPATAPDDDAPPHGDADAPDGKSKQASKGKPKGPSIATQLLGLITARYSLGSTTDGRHYAVPRPGFGPHIARPLRGGSSIRSEVAALYAALNNGKVPSASACADALNAAEGLCNQADPVDTQLRVARHDDRIILDLGDAAGRVASIGADGWEILDRSPVLFRRTNLTSAFPEPVRGGSLDELRGNLNVTDESWPLLVGYLVACLVPGIPHPIGLLTGEQGTGKTTAAEIIMGLVDPSPVPLRSEPRSTDDWVITAAASWAVCLDNISELRPWLSDALCRAATGEGLLKRELYTDEDVKVFTFRRCVLLTSIDPGALRGDLADRLATIELERIPASRRRTDADVKAALNEAQPRLFGALLQLLSDVMRETPKVELDGLPRMADFMLILSALDRVLKTDSVTTFDAHAARLAADVVDGDPVANEVLKLMRTNTEWEGTATDLLGLLERPDGIAKRDWPHDGTRLSARVRRSAPALAKLGIDVKAKRSGTRRLLVLTRTVDADALPEDEIAATEPF